MQHVPSGKARSFRIPRRDGFQVLHNASWKLKVQVMYFISVFQLAGVYESRGCCDAPRRGRLFRVYNVILGKECTVWKDNSHEWKYTRTVFNSEFLNKNNYLLSLLKMLKYLICDAPVHKHKSAWKAIIYGPYFTLIKNLSGDYSDYSAIFSDIKACFSLILIHYIIIIQSFQLS